MSGIRLEELKLLVGQNANGLWQFTVAPPEAGCCVVIQSFRERPARWSARASSARASSLPAFASASSCASHSAAFKAITARPLQALVRHPLTAPGSLECERPDARLGRPNPTPSF